MTEISKLTEILESDPFYVLSDTETEMLLGHGDRSLLVSKVLAVRLFKTGRYSDAISVSEEIVEVEWNAENTKNHMHLLTKAQDFEAAFAFAERAKDVQSDIQYNDMMCTLCNSAGRIPEAVEFGTESLRLKDAAAPKVAELKPQVRTFNPDRHDRNIIAFSLFGADPRYLIGARNNAIVARYLYPGWRARFYVDESVPLEVRSGLQAEGAQVALVENASAKDFGLFWRFFVEDDPDVDIYLIRDADSVLNIRERVAVDAWLKSGRAFHVMRDDPQHSELILAGMWGAHQGNIGNMVSRVQAFVANSPVVLNNATIDQHFLRSEIWPIVKQDVICHDAHLKFGDVTQWPSEATVPQGFNVGRNDWVHYRSSASQIS